MDPRVSESKGSRPLRRLTRSTRQPSVSVKVLAVEPTVRGPLKRTRKGLKNQAPAVNGSGDVETGSDDDDEESPSKKRRTKTGRPEDDSGDKNEMDVQESNEDLENNDDQEMDRIQDSSHGTRGDENEMDVQESNEDLENNEDQEMDRIQDSSHGTRQPTTYHGNLGDINLSPRVMLDERLRSSLAVNESERMKTKRVKPSTKEPVAPTKSAAQIRPPANRRDVLVTSMADYKRTMEAKATGIPTVNHHAPRVYPASEKSYTMRQRVNNISTQKGIAQHKKQGLKKTAVKKSSGYSCRGFIWYLALLVLLCSALLLACKIIPVLKKTSDGGPHPSRAVKPEIFADHLSILETQFPSQRSELWRMSKIHLERHLQTAQPTEPVSLIFTAGHRAERTLHCLAQRLAASFSTALNASVLHIDGASKAGQDSDAVKLDIDSQLRAAFEGDKPVAVINRFEELPPGSTLIFYRYCDHETAAYKRVFLLFTVLLPQDEVTVDQSLKYVEETVYDYVRERLVDSSNQAGFNDMDVDKYSGLWSRISHLILPVVSEKEVEQNGC